MKTTLTLCLAIFIALPLATQAQLWPIETVRSNISGAWTRSADFDQDGAPDILVQSGDTIFWYENLRPGWAPHIIDLTFYDSKYGYVDVLDLDGDGDTDVIKVPTPGNGGDPLTWNENKAGGTEWESHTLVTSVGSVNWMQSSWGDLDDDGDQDVVVPEVDFNNDPVQTSLYWLENNGSEETWTKHPLKAGSYFYSSVADLDGDGDPDIACSENQEGVFWLENQLPSPDWVQHPINDNGDLHLVGACVDLNADGAADVASAMANGGMAYFANPGWEQVNINSAPQIYFGVFGDVDGDGDPDVPYGGWGSLPQPLGWAENQNSGATWVLHDITSAEAIQRIPSGLSDIDGDGDMDMISLTFDFNTGLGSAFWAANPKISVGVAQPPANWEHPVLAIAPNPFSSATTIRYQLHESGEVRLSIHNLLGQPVRTLSLRRQDTGAHTFVWDRRMENGERAPQGVYWVRLKLANGEVNGLVVAD